MTPAEFQAAFPDFKDVDAAVIQRHIDASVDVVKPVPWGSGYANALGYWVAHFISMERKRMAIGITAKAGDVISATTAAGSRSRSGEAVMAGIFNPMLKTEYGQMFVYLENKLLGIPLVSSSSSRGFSSRGQGTASSPAGWDYPIRNTGGSGFVGD